MEIVYGLALFGGLIGVVAAFIVPRRWSVENTSTGDRRYFLAFTKTGAKMRARYIMHLEKWSGYRLRRHF